jgi:hypothetical protein
MRPEAFTSFAPAGSCGTAALGCVLQICGAQAPSPAYVANQAQTQTDDTPVPPRRDEVGQTFRSAFAEGERGRVSEARFCAQQKKTPFLAPQASAQRSGAHRTFISRPRSAKAPSYDCVVEGQGTRLEMLTQHNLMHTTHEHLTTRYSCYLIEPSSRERNGQRDASAAFIVEGLALSGVSGT